MFRRTRQQLTAVLAVFAVVAFAVLPAEHVHVSRAHDGHRSDLVHRHFEPHHRAATQPAVDLADDNHDVEWLSSSFTGEQTAALAGPDNHLVERALSILRPELTLGATIASLFGSVHDPPWATPSGLRGPPASRLLF